MLNFLNNPYDGDEWEDCIDNCYRLRYQHNGYQKIPANYKGDAGVEGYTKHGIVYQCYCPEKMYSDNDLWEKQRDKVTKDINKLVSNGDRLKDLGIESIKEWHFVTPEYRDPRILKHCEVKRKEIVKKIEENNLEYIDKDIKICVKVGEDFKEEMHKLVFLGENKFDISLKNTGNPDWSECSSEKIENIKKKLKAVIKPEEGEKNLLHYQKLVDFIVVYYINGIKVLNNIELNDPILYEKILEIDHRYKKDVEFKCIMNLESEKNNDLFNKIVESFKKELLDEFDEILTTGSIGELVWDMISAWIADCPMEFID